MIDPLHNAAKIDDNSVGSDRKLKVVKIMCLYIDSLLKHLDETQIFVEQEMPHVPGINETKLDENVSDDEIALEGYTVIRNDRNTSGGGVALFVHNDIPFIKRSDLSCKLESLSIELKIQNIKPIIVTILYGPPGKPVEVFGFIDNLFHKLDDEGKEYITIGDMNCDLLKPSKQRAKYLKRIYNKHNVTQLIKEPTRTTDDTKTLIDHINANNQHVYPRIEPYIVE